MRKEIAKSVKDEIEIRRKVRNDEELIDLEELLDVRSMANKIEDFKNKTKNIQKTRMTEKKNKVVDGDIKIPGLNDSPEGGVKK
jgi:DNA primase catalytic subunit